MVNKTLYKNKIAELQKTLEEKAGLVSVASGKVEELKKEEDKLKASISGLELVIKNQKQIIKDTEERNKKIQEQVRLYGEASSSVSSSFRTEVSNHASKIRILEDREQKLAKNIVNMELEIERYEKGRVEYLETLKLTEGLKKTCEDKYNEADKALVDARELRVKADELLRDVKIKEDNLNKFKEDILIYARRTNQFYEEHNLKSPIDLSKLV